MKIPLLIFSLMILCLAPVGEVAAAEYIGSDKCAECHGDLAKAFNLNVHSKADMYGEKGGCESCHGPGMAHAAAGDKSAIINPMKVEIEKSTEMCLECHDKEKGRMFWPGSAHSMGGVGCVACHMVHSNKMGLLAKGDEKEVCFACHREIRSSLLKRSHHPMRDSSTPSTMGKMTCSSCHNPHGAMSDKLIAAKSINDKCYECHMEKKAPVLWEHSPVKEDCLTCHSAHGSSNDKLLVTKIPRLCQQCHMQGRHQSGTLATNSTYAFNRSCLNCHPMVHGSNAPSGPVLQR